MARYSTLAPEKVEIDLDLRPIRFAEGKEKVKEVLKCDGKEKKEGEGEKKE